MINEQRGPWTKHDSAPLLQRRFFTAHSDTVTTPAGTDGVYDWVEAPDLVRVAAVDGDRIWMVEQHHYLPNRVMWQLPGGNIDSGEVPAVAAARELAEEVGAAALSWQSYGAVWPMPGLSSAQVHLYAATDLQLGEANPEASEADLVAKPVPLVQAIAAAMNGQIGCAASAQLVLAVAARTKSTRSVSQTISGTVSGSVMQVGNAGTVNL